MNKKYILQINAGATHGGAAKVAINLKNSLLKKNFDSQLAIGAEIPHGEHFFKIPKKSFSHAKNRWGKAFYTLCKKTNKYTGKIKGAGRLTNILYNIGTPSCLIKNIRGVENFENFPGTHAFFENLHPFPDIIHAHNLHDKYFDLQILPTLSNKVPVVLTLHDEWMFTGHCAATFGCNRWKQACGSCPDLKRYPAVWRDTTKYNLKQKHEIYKKSKLHIITPSQWLMDKVTQSILQPAIQSTQVIHNGIDLKIFKPGKKSLARKKLDVTTDAHVLLFVAYNAKTNAYKDYKTLEKALFLCADKTDKQTPFEPIILFCIGENSKTIKRQNVEIRFIKYLHSTKELVTYYQAADLLIHATLSDIFPTTILEAFATGLPVIGTNVGGIPEQIDTNTGLLYEKSDVKDLAQKIFLLLGNQKKRDELSKNCVKKAHEKFDLNKQINNYIKVYEKISQNKGAM